MTFILSFRFQCIEKLEECKRFIFLCTASIVTFNTLHAKQTNASSALVYLKICCTIYKYFDVWIFLCCCKVYRTQSNKVRPAVIKLIILLCVLYWHCPRRPTHRLRPPPAHTGSVRQGNAGICAGRRDTASECFTSAFTC